MDLFSYLCRKCWLCTLIQKQREKREAKIGEKKGQLRAKAEAKKEMLEARKMAAKWLDEIS